MIDEYEEFHAYTKPVQYTAAGKRDTTWVGRFTFDMLLKFEGFARILTIIARGYMHRENTEPDIDRARRALCAWCSVPYSKKASPQKDWQFSTVFSDLHGEFPELVDKNGVGWLVRHVRNLCAFARNNPSVISKPAQKHCETLSHGFEADWRKKVHSSRCRSSQRGQKVRGCCALTTSLPTRWSLVLCGGRRCPSLLSKYGE